MIVIVLMVIVAFVVLYVIYVLIMLLTGHDPETGGKINRSEYLQGVQEKDRIRSGKLRPDEVRLFEDYLAGTACIGLSPYCVGRKSKTAVVCSVCYRAQGRNNPIGFAQSGGGATREQLIRKVVRRLSELGKIDGNTLPVGRIDGPADKERKGQSLPIRMSKSNEMIITKRGKYVDFVIPVLKTIESLGGKAWLSDIEQEFYKHFNSFLDPTIDWQEKTGNHNKQLWRDCCGSRVAYWQLKPNGYITIERHGSRGSIWSITQLGREKIKETAWAN